MTDLKKDPLRNKDSWRLEIILSGILIVPGVFAGSGWKWIIASWMICLLSFGSLLKVFGRGFVIHAFMATSVVAILAALIISTYSMMP